MKMMWRLPECRPESQSGDVACQDHANCSGEPTANKPRRLLSLVHLRQDYIVTEFH